MFIVGLNYAKKNYSQTNFAGPAENMKNAS